MANTSSSARLLVAPSKAQVPAALTSSIVKIAKESLEKRNAVTIALSGGSLPGFLSTLPDAFEAAGVDPRWKDWHVLLADERCVSLTHPDSNLRALQEAFLSQTSVAIPASQIHGISQDLLQEGAEAVAHVYDIKLKSVLENHSAGMLDLAVLGFGPDGHTCSLFPNHALLNITSDSHKWVASIEDSPKPPSQRITLTLPFLNHFTRHVLFCGAGSSKQPIVQAVLHDISLSSSSKRANPDVHEYDATVTVPPLYPCGMVTPVESLTWIVDHDAVEGLSLTASPAHPRQVADADVYVKPTEAEVADELCQQIVQQCANAMEARGVFSIAVSGGSLPWMLHKLPLAFQQAGVDPQYPHWHVLLADERCVPQSHGDSNMGALKGRWLDQVYEKIPHQHIYELDQISLAESIEVAALEYQVRVHTVLKACGGMLDLAVLDFGPDGHTCSLFPGHALLQERTRWVAGITDSPKPPEHRITLTLAVLNDLTRHVVFCGTGDSKGAVLKSIFAQVAPPKGSYQEQHRDPQYIAHLNPTEPQYPCGMVRPTERLVYIVDQAAMDRVEVSL